MIPINNFILTIGAILVFIGVASIITNSYKFIVVSRIFVIFTSIVCIILSIFSGDMETVRSNLLLSYMSIYSFAGAIFLYLIPIYLFIFDTYFLYKSQDKKYLYFFVVDVLLPILAVSLYDNFFSQIRM